MSSAPLLSVIVPSHNVDSWVVECLRSILDQDYTELEVIVVDDHSDDNTLDLVERLAETDRRLSVIEAHDRGGANARNVGAAAASGEYVIFADSDDLIPRGAYGALVRSLESSGSDMAVGRFLKFSPTDTWDPTRNWPSYRKARRSVRLADEVSLIRGRACWNKMFRRSFWVRHSIEYPEVPRSNDIVPMVTAMTRARSIDVVPDVVYLYRERPGATSMTAKASKVVGLLSYLAQEIECARMVADLGASVLSREYGRLVFAADGWVHIDRVLAVLAEDIDEEDRARLARLCVALIDLTDASAFESIPFERQLVFLLLAVGDVQAARGVHAAIHGESEAIRSGSAEDWGRRVRDISRTFASEGRFAGAVLTYAVRLVTSGVLDRVQDRSSVRSAHDELVHAAQSLDSDVVDGLDEDIRMFLRPLNEAAADDYAAAGALLRQGFAAVNITRQSRKLVVTGTSSVDSRPAVGMRLVVDGPSLSFVPVMRRGRLWKAVFPRTLPDRGELAVDALVEIGGVEVGRVPVHIVEATRRRRVPRTARVGLADRINAAYTGPLIVVGYDVIVRRVARIAVRRLPDPISAQIRRVYALAKRR